MKAKFLLFGMVMAVDMGIRTSPRSVRHRQTSIHPLT